MSRQLFIYQCEQCRKFFTSTARQMDCPDCSTEEKPVRMQQRGVAPAGR